MDDFKILTDEEVSALSNAERRKYLKAKKEYDNKMLVESTLNKSDSTEEQTQTEKTEIIIEEKTTEENKSNTENVAAEIDPNRNYSPYYTPKPKLGTKGGTLGRGAVSEEERKVQFSLTCTPAQKERFKEAAQKDHRKLPDFICLAVEEYIENHNL